MDGFSLSSWSWIAGLRCVLSDILSPKTWFLKLFGQESQKWMLQDCFTCILLHLSSAEHQGMVWPLTLSRSTKPRGSWRVQLIEKASSVCSDVFSRLSIPAHHGPRQWTKPCLLCSKGWFCHLSLFVSLCQVHFLFCLSPQYPAISPTCSSVMFCGLLYLLLVVCLSLSKGYFLSLVSLSYDGSGQAPRHWSLTGMTPIEEEFLLLLFWNRDIILKQK